VKQSGVLQVPIIPGMREDIDPRAGATPGTILYAQNLRFRQGGKAQRRAGSVELVNTSDAPVTFPVVTGYPPDFVSTVGGVPCIGSNGYGQLYDEQEDVWRPAGLYSSAMPVRRLLTMYLWPGAASHGNANGAATVAIDSAGYMVAAYCVNEAVIGLGQTCVAKYFDPNGNLIQVTQYSTTVRARAVTVGATIYLVLQDSAATNAVVEAYTYTAGNISGPTTLVTLDATADSWDVSPWPAASAANRWLIVWYDSSSTTVTVRRLNALATEASTTFTPSGAPRIACHAHTDHAWIGTVDDTSQAAKMYGYAWAGAWGAVIGPTNAWTFTAAQEDSSPPIPGPSDVVTACNFAGWIETNSAVSSAIGTFQYKSGSYNSAATLNVRTDYGAYPISYPFGPIGEYVWTDVLTNADTVNGGVPGKRRSALMHRWRKPSATNDSRSFPELSTKRNVQWIDDTDRVDRWTRPAQRPNGNWVMPIAVWIPDDTTGAIYYEFLEFEAPCQTTRVLADAAGALTAPGQPVDLLPGGGLAGGVENGVIHAPTITYAVVTGGGTMAAGVYFFCACYRWIDAAGRVRKSAPSEIVTVTAALNDAVNLRVSCISFFRATLSNGDVGQIELYGTPVNEASFYLVDDSRPAQGAGAIEAYNGVTYSTATLTDNAQIYTDGGVQQNDFAPSCRAVVATEDTLAAFAGWDRTLVQESKPIFPEEPATFSDFDGFKIRFPEDLVTGAYMDGALLGFAERAIYAVTGAGPNDQGQGGRPPPRCIVSGLGTKNERSVVMTPVGCFFESHRGIELLPRGLGAPEFVGAGVQDQLALRPTILDACFHVGEVATTAQFLIESPGAVAAQTPVFDSGIGLTFTELAAQVPNGMVFSVPNHALGAGSNRMVFAFITLDLFSLNYIPASASVTYNGVGMTLISEFLPVTTRGIIVFGMLEAALPAAGSYAVAAAITLSGTPTSTTAGATLSVVSYNTVPQTLPTSPVTTYSAGSLLTSSIALTVPTGGVAIDCVCGSSSNGSHGPDVGQNERVDLDASSQQSGVSDKFADGAVTMGWTFTSVQGFISQLGFVLSPIPAVGNYGRKILAYDIDAAAWSVDDYSQELAAFGATPQGLLLAHENNAGSPAFLLEDTSLSTDDGVFFEGRLQLHTFYPVGYCGVTALQGTVARVSLDANPTTVNVSVVTDEVNSKLGTVVGTDTSAMKLYELGPGNFSNKVTSIAIEAYDSTAGGATWHGFTIYHEPEPEMTHPSATTERI
jgi:hypothetical protein